MTDYQPFTKNELKKLPTEIRKALETVEGEVLRKYTTKGHLLLLFPNGRTALLSGTPSDHRSMKNSAADIRRESRRD